MTVREVSAKDKAQFNFAVDHPLQSWEWGEFRQKTGKKVIRLGVFEGDKLTTGYQLTVHPLSKTGFSVLYLPRGPIPDKTMLEVLRKIGQKEKAILIKMEPDVATEISNNSRSQSHQEIHDFLIKNGCRKGKPFFYQHTFKLDLTKSEEELLAAMHAKTRYNIRLSQRHEVEVAEDNSDKAYETFIKLFFETTKRQRFYGHTPDYYRKMKEVLVPAKIEHLFLARHKGKVLAAYVFFIFKDTLYYLYGGSTRDSRKVMPTYAIFWHVIKLARARGLKKFDLWAALGPNPNPQDPWYGFHRFKAGFGGKMVEFIGTYDLVINPTLYFLYQIANKLRWQFLKLKTRLPF